MNIQPFLITALPRGGAHSESIDYILSEDEVMRVFTVPLMWLADRSHWEVRPFLRLPDKWSRWFTSNSMMVNWCGG
jgi:hypothetical protein